MTGDSKLSVELSEVCVTRRFSRRVSVYILKEFLLIFFCLVGGFLLLMLVGQMMNDLSDFRGKKVSTGEIISYFIYLLPEQVRYILPMSLLMATMRTVAAMSKHNEMSALRAAGVSILQAFFPFIIVGTVAGCFQFYCAEYLAPHGNEAASQIRRQRLGDHDDNERKFIAYRNKAKMRDWFLRGVDKNGVCTGIIIQQFDSRKNIIWEFTAESGHFDPNKNRWVFLNAQQTKVDPAEGWPIPGEKQERCEMELDERAKGIAFFSRIQVVNDVSFDELWGFLTDSELAIPDLTRNILWTSLFFRLFFPLSCVISVLLGVPMAVTLQRTGVLRKFLEATAIMVSFYVVSQGVMILGSNPYVPAIVAGGLPAAGYLAFAAYQLLRKL